MIASVSVKHVAFLGLVLTLMHLNKSRQEGLTILISSFLLAAVMQRGGYTHSISIDYEASLLACTSLGSRMYQWPYAIKVGAEVIMETSALTLLTFSATVTPVIVLNVLVPSSLLDGSPEVEIVVKALGLAVLLASGAAVFADPTFQRQAPPVPAATVAATRKSTPGVEGRGGWLSTFTWYNSWGYSGHRDLLLLSIPYLFLLFLTGANLLEIYADYVIGGSWQSSFHMRRLVAFGWIEVSYLLLGYFNQRGMLDLNAFDKEDQDGLSFAIPISGGRGRTSSKQPQAPHRIMSVSGTPSSTTTRHSPARDGGNLYDLGSSSASAFSTPLRHKNKRGGDSGGRTHRSPSKEILAISMSPTRGSPPSDDKIKLGG